MGEILLRLRHLKSDFDFRNDPGVKIKRIIPFNPLQGFILRTSRN